MECHTISILQIKKTKPRKLGTEGLSNLSRVTLLISSEANFIVRYKSIFLFFGFFLENTKPPVFRPEATPLWPN